MYHNWHKLFLLQKRVDITLNFLVSGHFMLRVRIVGISECVVAPWVPSVTCYMLRANCYNAKRWKCYLLCYIVYASKHYTSLRCEDSLTHWHQLTSQGNTFLQLNAFESIIFNSKVKKSLNMYLDTKMVWHNTTAFLTDALCHHFAAEWKLEAYFGELALLP